MNPESGRPPHRLRPDLMSSDKPDFRTDINGLRAYAVAAVMLFHFRIPGFTGGFSGVDVFFVISGFLMTKILVNDARITGRQEAWNWLTDFYLGRALRIVPALAALCATLLLLGAFLLLAPEFALLAANSVATLTFLSNFVFWLGADHYLKAASHENWLLHTWSLSVEWQFYLAYPPGLWLIWRLFRASRARLSTLIAGFAASFALSLFITPANPDAAFYLLPTRFWELLAGALVFFLPLPRSVNSGTKRLIEAAGFVLILAAVFLLDERSPWPGYRAAMPVLGSALVLLAARQDSPWTRLPIMQALGKWSYSLYLWHWPLVVGLFYLERLDDPYFATGALIATLMLGKLSHAWVETPTRRALSRHTRRSAFAFIAAASLTVALSALSILLASGVPGRQPQEVERLLAEIENINPRYHECHVPLGGPYKHCLYGGKKIRVIFVGDSHSISTVSAMQQALDDPKAGVLSFSYSWCPTIFGVKKTGQDDQCAGFNEWMLEQIASIPADVPLVIVNRTSAYPFGWHQPGDKDFGRPKVYFDSPVATPTPAFQAQFKEHLAASACRIARTRPVWMMRPIPEMMVDVPRVAARRQQFYGGTGDISLSLADYHQRHWLAWQAQDEARTRCGIHLLDPLPYLCDGKHCFGVRDSRSLYSDTNHLSEYGNRLLVPMFREALQ